jgi:hypothetical protein
VNRIEDNVIRTTQFNQRFSATPGDLHIGAVIFDKADDPTPRRCVS